MKKIFSVLICIVLFLPLACCAGHSQSKLTEEQLMRLENLFDTALEEADVQWGDALRYIPKIFAENEDFRFKVSSDPESKQKGLHLDLASREFGTFSIGNYQFRNNFCSIFYGTSNEALGFYKSAEHVKRYKENGTEWYFSSSNFEGLKLSVLLVYMPDEASTCYVMVDLPNESEFTNKLARKMIEDFSCILF